MKNKDLRFCLETLKSLQKRKELEPEQKSALEVAERKLKELWRKTNPAKADICRVVRRIAEAILRAFDEKQLSK